MNPERYTSAADWAADKVKATGIALESESGRALFNFHYVDFTKWDRARPTIKNALLDFCDTFLP